MTGLEVGNAALGVGEQSTQQTHQVWDTMDDVLTEAMKEGFFLMEMPRFAPPSADPEELANATPDKYALKFSQAEYWQSYSQSTLAWLDGLLLQCSNEMDIIEVDTKRFIRDAANQAKEKKPAETIIMDEVKANPRWRELLLTQQRLSQKRGVIEGQYKRMGRVLKILSRFVEFRKNEMGGSEAGRRYLG